MYAPYALLNGLRIKGARSEEIVYLQSRELEVSFSKTAYGWAGSMYNKVGTHTLTSSKRVKGLTLTAVCYSRFLRPAPQGKVGRTFVEPNANDRIPGTRTCSKYPPVGIWLDDGGPKKLRVFDPMRSG